MQVWYIELRGPQALEKLRPLLEKLPRQPGFSGAELLASPEQPELALIASRWEAHPPTLALPESARHWSFVVCMQAPATFDGDR